jgi:hypothetical protein
MSKIKNKVVRISNYCAPALQKALDTNSAMGYKIVSYTVAPHEHGVLEMFLFFAKEGEENKNQEEGEKVEPNGIDYETRRRLENSCSQISLW